MIAPEGLHERPVYHRRRDHRDRGRRAILLYNGLVQKRLRIDEAFAQIEVQLKRRHDLIPNLVNAVKGYMGFEQKVLTDVTNARAAASPPAPRDRPSRPPQRTR